MFFLLFLFKKRMGAWELGCLGDPKSREEMPKGKETSSDVRHDHLYCLIKAAANSKYC